MKQLDSAEAREDRTKAAAMAAVERKQRDATGWREALKAGARDPLLRAIEGGRHE